MEFAKRFGMSRAKYGRIELGIEEMPEVVTSFLHESESEMEAITRQHREVCEVVKKNFNERHEAVMRFLNEVTESGNKFKVHPVSRLPRQLRSYFSKGKANDK